MQNTPEQFADTATLAARLLGQNRREDIAIVAVCGFAGAGKTTLCRSILKAFPDRTAHFECDRFSRYSFKEREQRIAAQCRDANGGNPHENPLHWYDWHEIEMALDGLRKQRRFEFTRAWNPASGELDARYTLDLAERPPTLVLCDGIFLLHAPVTSWFDTAVLVDCPEPLRRARAEIRTKDSTRRAYMNQLERTYCQPYFQELSSRADIVYTVSDVP